MIEDLIHGPKSSAERCEKLPLIIPNNGPSRFSIYMSKLEKQRRKAETSLFSKVNVYFNGFTDKYNVSQLKNELYKHGGATSYLFSASKTTHVVCTNLATSKIQQFSSTKRKIHIVHPDWIIQSVKRSKLQPETLFAITSTNKSENILDYTEKVNNAPTLESQHSVKSNSLSISSEEDTTNKSVRQKNTHPLMKIRRSAKNLENNSEPEVQTEREIMKLNQVNNTINKLAILKRLSLKESRIKSILKKNQSNIKVPDAQSSHQRSSPNVN